MKISQIVSEGGGEDWLLFPYDSSISSSGHDGGEWYNTVFAGRGQFAGRAPDFSITFSIASM